MKTPAIKLPDYELPPVIEVVCGIQYGIPDAFTAAALGLFWQRVRGEYPNSEQHPPLPQVIERFGEPAPDETRVEVSNVLPVPRMFFVGKIPSWLLQLQSDRFLHNWRKHRDQDAYPRFPEVFKRFWSAWRQFLAFCQEERISTPNPNQLEITYINHIMQGQGWDGTASIGQIFPDIAWRTERSFLPSPESVAWKTSYTLPENVGRLHVSMRHAVRRSDSKPVLLCELTVRGLPHAVSDESVEAWFKLGREWIVRGFADLTSDTVQRSIWRKKA